MVTLLRAVLNEKGFTLIEMLSVLFIVMLFTGIALTFSFQYSEKKVIDQFMNQVQLDILTAQAKAIGEQQRIEIQFSEDHRYTMFNSFMEPYNERLFPEGVTFNKYSNLKVIRFSPSGEVNAFGTLKFNTEYGDKELIININKGRIRYEK